MTSKFVAVIAVLAALSAPALAQDKEPAPVKVSKAEVQALVNSIKNDKAKLAVYCDLTKLRADYEKFGEKKEDPKLEELDKKMEDLNQKLGADFMKIAVADMDEESEKVFDSLADSCK
jgi:hypothetical protein